VKTAKLLGFAASVSSQSLSLLLCLWTAHAASAVQPQTKAAKAPPLQACNVTAISDLGSWDDVFVAHDRDVIVLRRGDELFSLAMAVSATPRKIAKAPAAGDTQIIAGATVGEKYWLFLNSSKAEPCALDAYSGAVAKFVIPGVRLPGSHAPVIQSCEIVPHVQAALLMVSGGDRSTWPRDGNRPVYFWMNLKSGNVVRFSIGWDLKYFSADERVAVFASPVEKQAIDMRTGDRINALPDRRKERSIPFDWTNTQSIKPLYERREGKGDADYFVGLSVDGLVLPVALRVEDVRYLAMAKAGGGFVAFRLRREGAALGEPSPLWVVPFKDAQKAEPIATEVTDFTMLGQGNAVFVTIEHGGKPASSGNHNRHAEAFFHARADRSSWNVLEGVERLPTLDKIFADADYVMDSLRVRLIEGFGASRHEPLVLCLCEHQRADLRAQFISAGKTLESTTWRRALLIAGDGRRSLTPLFREGNLPDEIWLHNSGKLLTGTYVWQESESGRKRRVQLSESTLERP
jgi:hypothetical protein